MKSLVVPLVLSLLLVTFNPAILAAGTQNSPLKIVIAGDSTVCDYPANVPERGWGMYIEERFKPGTVRVVNLAKPGRSTKTFISEGRWQQALAGKPDYILIQFGHNDSHASDKPEATDPATEYKVNLRRFIDDAHNVGAAPILITPMVRRNFDPQGKINETPPPTGHALVAYATAMKEVAAEKKVPLIDLYATSRALAEKLGPVKSLELANKQGDPTHFNEKGARAMAGLVMDELPEVAPKLKDALNAP